MDKQTKRAWAGLANLANGIAIDAGQIRRILADCMHWVAAIEPFGLLDLMRDEELLRQAEEYRHSIEGLLRWLSSDSQSSEGNRVQQQCLSFLREHTEHIGGMRLKEVCFSLPDLEKLNYSQAELERFKEEHDAYWKNWEDFPLGILAPSKDYKDIADPICDFLLSEYQRRRSKERHRKDKKPPPIVPTFVCPRCNKLVMPDRTGKKKYCSECSDRARAEKYRDSASPDENKDYQWLYRLRKAEPGVRKMRLRKLKDKKRLNEIKERQRESSRCQSLLLDMRL